MTLMDMRYLVLPERPLGTENWNEEELSRLISRDHLVGIRVTLKKKNNKLVLTNNHSTSYCIN